MKRIWKSIMRNADIGGFRDAAIKEAEKIGEGKLKIIPPKYPTEPERGPKDSKLKELIKEELQKKPDKLLDNAAKISIKSTDPPERWTSVKDLPTHESEALHKYDDNWEFGFYETPTDKIPDKRIAFREALEYLRARSELTESQENYVLLEQNREDHLKYVVHEHPSVKRMDPQAMDNIFEYFRIFERNDEQRVVFKRDINYLYDQAQGQITEADMLALYRPEAWENLRQKVRSLKVRLPNKEEFEKLDDTEKKQAIEAAVEIRKMEHERLNKRLREIDQMEEAFERQVKEAENNTRTAKEVIEKNAAKTGKETEKLEKLVEAEMKKKQNGNE